MTGSNTRKHNIIFTLAMASLCFNSWADTNTPRVDGSLHVAIDGPMRQMLLVLDERVREIQVEDAAAVPEVVSTQSINLSKEESKTESHEHVPESEPEGSEPKPEEPKPESEPKPRHEPKPKSDSLPKPESKPEPENKPEKKPKSKRKAKPKPKPVKGLWGQLLGDDIRQGDRPYAPGYHAQVGGGIIGWDRNFFCPAIVLGGAIGYQQAHVGYNAVDDHKLDVKRFHGTLYGLYFPPQWPIYVKAAITRGYNEYDDHRFTTDADFDGVDWNIFIEKGYIAQCKNLRFIPKVSLMYANLKPHGYTEYGTNDYTDTLEIHYHSMAQLPLGIGFLLDYQNIFPHVYVVPEMHAMYFHDFIRDPQAAQARLAGNGDGSAPYFYTEGPKPGADSVEIGLGLTVHSFTHTLIRFQYDFYQSAHYHRNQVFIKARYEWA